MPVVSPAACLPQQQWIAPVEFEFQSARASRRAADKASAFHLLRSPFAIREREREKSREFSPKSPSSPPDFQQHTPSFLLHKPTPFLTFILLPIPSPSSPRNPAAFLHHFPAFHHPEHPEFTRTSTTETNCNPTPSLLKLPSPQSTASPQILPRHSPALHLSRPPDLQPFPSPQTPNATTNSCFTH